MKLIFIIILLNFTNAFGQRKYIKTINDFALKAGVIETEEKSYTLKLYSSFNNTPVEQYELEKIIKRKFNSSGLLIEDTEIEASTKKTLGQDKYDFNEIGQLMKYSFVSDRTNLKVENIYNKNNQLIEQSDFFNGELQNKYIFKYINNKLRKLTFIDVEKNENIFVKTYKYNKLDSLISIEEIFKNGNRITTDFISENRNKTIIESHFKKNLLKSKREAVFNRHGIKSKQTRQDFNSLGNVSYEIAKEFDTNGLEKLLSKKEGEWSHTITTTYDDFLNPVKEQKKYIKSGAINKELFSYKYDKKGNWVIKCHKRFSNSKFGIEPIVVIKRLLKYNTGEYSKRISKHEALSFCVPNYKNRLKKFLIKEKKTPKIFIKDIEEGK